MERSPVKHVVHGHDLYSLIVFSYEGRPQWFVTRIDMTPGRKEYWGKLLAQGKAKDEADSWAQAEAFLKSHRKDKTSS